MGCRAVGFIVTLALSILMASLTAEAQRPSHVPRIGVLSGGAFTPDSREREAFRQGLRALGYVEGQTIVLEERLAEGKLERLPDLAAELVRLQVEIIVAGSGPAARAAGQATRRIPIVLAGGDAVGTGLIANIARPDGNITGLTTNAAELSGKWLELLKEAVPAVSRVAVLSHPDELDYRTGIERDAGRGPGAGGAAAIAERARCRGARRRIRGDEQGARGSPRRAPGCDL